MTLFVSLFVVRQIPYHDQTPTIGEKLLIEDHSSPVGYKVPSLPDYEIDPELANPGLSYIPICMEYCIGILLAITIGIVCIGFAFTNWDDDLYTNIDNTV